MALQQRASAKLCGVEQRAPPIFTGCSHVLLLASDCVYVDGMYCKMSQKMYTHYSDTACSHISRQILMHIVSTFEALVKDLLWRVCKLSIPVIVCWLETD